MGEYARARAGFNTNGFFDSFSLERTARFCVTTIVFAIALSRWKGRRFTP